MGGGDKCMRPLAGETLLARVIARVAPQVGPLILNANGDPARFAPYGLPVVADVMEGHAGPLAGILTALDWAAENAPHHPLVASFRHRCAVPAAGSGRDHGGGPRPLRAPTSPVPRRTGGRIRCSGSGRWSSAPTCAMPWWSRASARSTAGPQVTGWWRSPFPCTPVDPFFNANREDDLAEAERLIAAHGPAL